MRLLLAALLLALFPATASATVEVTVSESRITGTVGQYLNIRSTITNTGSSPTGKLIAHLNVASLNDVYVDLEDWTAAPTQSLPPLGPGQRAEVSWDIQAVNAGVFNVYAVVLPSGSESLAVSPPIHVEVAGRRTLSAGGALPIALIVPILLGIAVYAVRRRLRDTA
ncbi:hypothetical protein SAMN04488564_111291 [Lentzea waywayandensis]|uniref:Uncharacterized protein n=1 Tax=Lentzea waywayandensis TaxID=84724 RepID=A0A1I6FD58_9PSEU|nr:hypothetical protein [Lentzea waywayandensis]SFR27848.1 hypothetical protein SAMN04488564_111291 [Lentzea waywayandensis]